MKKAISQDDIVSYYDRTQDHMRWFWRLDTSMGLHYGVWEKGIRRLSDAILNTDRRLAALGQIKAGDKVLDAGCGVGGGSIFLAKNYGAQCTGITLSQKQVETARAYAAKQGVSQLTEFKVDNYLGTKFPDASFDVVWAMESMATAPDKAKFLQEMHRILKPGGRLLVCDYYKPYAYDAHQHKSMRYMMYSWAIPDILSIEEKQALAEQQGFRLLKMEDTTRAIKKSVNLIYFYALLGMLGTKAYVATHRNVTPASKNHFKAGLGQFHAYYKGLWKHLLWAFEKA